MASEYPIQDDDSEADAAIKVIEDSGDREKAMEMKLARSERKVQRLEVRATVAEAVGYKTELATEFPYADADSITGKTKAEMRSSAERIHQAVEKAIAKNGLTPSAAAKNAEDPRKADWGAPPPVATEEVTGEMPMDLSEVRRKVQDGTLSRADLLADIKKNGVRELTRPTLAGAAIKVRRTE